MSFIRWAGTWLPALIIVSYLLALLDEFLHEIGWERLPLYGVGATSLCFGAAALIQMARFSRARYPSFLMLTLIYQKLCLALIFGAIFFLILPEYVPWFPALPEVVIYPLLVGSVIATSVVNVVLWFGRKRGWLEEPADPMPLRRIWKR